MRHYLSLVLILLSVLPTSCLSAGGGAETRQETAAGLTFSVPKAWTASTPTSSMRAAQYTLPAEKETDAPELVLYFFGEGQGGDAQANVDRWIGQMQQPDGKPSAGRAKKETRKVGEYKVTLVSIDGTYAGMGGMMGMTASNPHDAAAPKPNYRLWAAVIEGKGGPWFFKGTGPRVAMQQAEKALNAMVASFKPAG